MKTEWYGMSIGCLAALERHAASHKSLVDAFEPWCALCAAAAEALNSERASFRHERAKNDRTER